MSNLPEYIDGLPNISGAEKEIEGAIAATAGRSVFLADSRIDFGRIKSAFASALHMHQPLIPAGGRDLRTAEVIGNLQHMFENQGVGDNHNASVFQWCYKRMGEFIPQLVGEGKEPRIMLEYSGTLLHGLRKQGANDVFDSLRGITCNPDYRRCVEWLGAPWGHAVAPSTPVQDYRLHVKAWQHYFAAIFGFEALSRVRGFSPSEMALPNHPDVAYEFAKTLRASVAATLRERPVGRHPDMLEGPRLFRALTAATAPPQGTLRRGLERSLATAPGRRGRVPWPRTYTK